MKITLVLDVPRLASLDEGKQFASLLAEQIYATPINDDGAIHSITSMVHGKEKGVR